MKTTTVRQHTRRKPQRPPDPFAVEIEAGIARRNSKVARLDHARCGIADVGGSDFPLRSENETALAKAIQAFRNFVETIRKGN